MTPGSLAVGQAAVAGADRIYPLFPSLVHGCFDSDAGNRPVPAELVFEHDKLDPSAFDCEPAPGLSRWMPLLPPIVPGLSMAEGGTPLLAAEPVARWAGYDGPLLIKDETRNPTASHKDRLGLCVVSAAVIQEAAGVVVASSGNHGASAAAYAARAGLLCVVLVGPDTPPAVLSFVRAYGAVVFRVSRQVRFDLVQSLSLAMGLHPIGNVGPTPTGHPFGAEGYKTIAYELFRQLGDRAPGTVYIPTGYGELLFGVAKGFQELHRHGRLSELPDLVACEPLARAPLLKAVRECCEVASVPPQPTDAYAIGVTQGSARAREGLRRCQGRVLGVPDGAMRRAQAVLAGQGIWAELSATASIAGLREETRTGFVPRAPVVALVTSSGFKDRGVCHGEAPCPEPTVEGILNGLRRYYRIFIERR